MSDTIQTQGESWIRLAWYEQRGQELSEVQAELAAELAALREAANVNVNTALRLMTQVEELTEAVRVLGEECRSQRAEVTEADHRYVGLCPHCVAQDRIRAARIATDANPIASATARP